MSTLLHDINVPTNQATFSMACFWAPDSLFGAKKGVIRTRVGYTGGTTPNPTYQKVNESDDLTGENDSLNESCTKSGISKFRDPIDRRDHAESILIDFDPNVISYSELLDMFWKNHDPSAKMKRQYTSMIHYHDDEQKQLAEVSLGKMKLEYNSTTVYTEILPASTFYDAEDYHQKYRLQQHTWLCKSVGLRSGNNLKKSHLAARLNGYVYGYGGLNQFDEEVGKLGLSEDVSDYVRSLIIKYEGQGPTC